jgi:hypothetical protein
MYAALGATPIVADWGTEDHSAPLSARRDDDDDDRSTLFILVLSLFFCFN